MSRVNEFVAVALLEIVVALFSLAAIEMVAEMAWCLFPDQQLEPFGPAGHMALIVLRHKQVAQVMAVLMVTIRFSTFIRVRWERELSRWLVWATWLTLQVLAMITVFFAGTYAVIAGTLPHQ